MMAIKHKFLCSAFFLILSSASYAIDNPDAPQYVTAFDSSSKIYLDKIADPKNTNSTYAVAYKSYQEFLDSEINKAYKLLLQKLPEKQKLALKKSQLAWIKHRDAEFAFIEENWVPANFGSSVVISKGDYKCKIIHDRVVQLLQYAQNY